MKTFAMKMVRKSLVIIHAGDAFVKVKAYTLIDWIVNRIIYLSIDYITGGEVTCNDVSCYIRDDCKPRYMKGVCCPTFDNCPPIGN